MTTVLLTRKEAAKRLNMSEDTLDVLRATRELAYIQSKPGGKVLIPESAIEAYLDRSMRPARPVNKPVIETYRRRRA